MLTAGERSFYRVSGFEEGAMPEVPEELDVFRLAHGHMKQLVKDMDKEVPYLGVYTYCRYKFDTGFAIKATFTACLK